MIKDIRTLFLSEKEEEDNYYESVGLVLFIETIILNKTKTYLKDIINDLNKSDTQKTQLTMALNFISSKDTDEEGVMHSKSNNKGIMINDEEDEVIEELLELLLSPNFETTMKDNDFILNCLDLFYYKCHKINMNRISMKHT